MKRTLVNTYKAVDTRIPKGTPVNMRYANLPPTYTPKGKSYLIGDVRSSIQLEDFDMIPGRAYFFVGEWKFGLISPWFGFDTREMDGVDVAITEPVSISGASDHHYRSIIAIPGTHVGVTDKKPSLYSQSSCGFTAVDDLFSGTIYEFSYSNPYAAYAGGQLAYPEDYPWTIPIVMPLACRVESAINPYYDRCSVELPLEGTFERNLSLMTSPEATHPRRPYISIFRRYAVELLGDVVAMQNSKGTIEVPDPGLTGHTVPVPDQASLNPQAPASGLSTVVIDQVPTLTFARYAVPVTATLLRVRTSGRISASPRVND